MCVCVCVCVFLCADKGMQIVAFVLCNVLDTEMLSKASSCFMVATTNKLKQKKRAFAMHSLYKLLHNMHSKSRFTDVYQYSIQRRCAVPRGSISHISYDYLGDCKSGNSVQCVADAPFNPGRLP